MKCCSFLFCFFYILIISTFISTCTDYVENNEQLEYFLLCRSLLFVLHLTSFMFMQKIVYFHSLNAIKKETLLLKYWYWNYIVTLINNHSTSLNKCVETLTKISNIKYKSKLYLSIYTYQYKYLSKIFKINI